MAVGVKLRVQLLDWEVPTLVGPYKVSIESIRVAHGKKELAVVTSPSDVSVRFDFRLVWCVGFEGWLSRHVQRTLFVRPLNF